MSPPPPVWLQEKMPHNALFCPFAYFRCLAQQKIGILADPSNSFHLSGYFANAWLRKVLLVPAGAFKERSQWWYQLEKSKLSENFGIAFYSVGFGDEKWVIMECSASPPWMIKSTGVYSMNNAESQNACCMFNTVFWLFLYFSEKKRIVTEYRIPNSDRIPKPNLGTCC